MSHLTKLMVTPAVTNEGALQVEESGSYHVWVLGITLGGKLREG